MRARSPDTRRARGTRPELLHPRGQLWLVVGCLGLGLVLAWLGALLFALPGWAGALLVVALLLVPARRKWRADLQALGTPLTVLSMLLVAQSLHTVEHLAQWTQYHLLGWPLKASSGLISPLNAEVVHFVWNWAVLLVVAYLLRAGVRTRWMWLLLVWAGAHTAEHTYLFVNYVRSGGIQGLPGVLGRGGWLAVHGPALAPFAFVCRVAPGLVDAPRLDVHFWWNVGEIGLLVAAAAAMGSGGVPVRRQASGGRAGRGRCRALAVEQAHTQALHRHIAEASAAPPVQQFSGSRTAPVTGDGGQGAGAGR